MRSRHVLPALLLLAPLLAGCLSADVDGDQDLSSRVTELWVVEDGRGLLVQHDRLLNASLDGLGQLVEAHGPLTEEQAQRLRTNTTHVRLVLQPTTDLGLGLMPHATSVAVDRAYLVLEGVDAVGGNVVLEENGTLGAWTTKANLTDVHGLAETAVEASAARAAREAASESSTPVGEGRDGPQGDSCSTWVHRLAWEQAGVHEAVQGLDLAQDRVHHERPGPSLVPALQQLVPPAWNASVADVRWQPTLEDDQRRSWEPLLVEPENGSLRIEGRFEQRRSHDQVGAWFTSFASNVTDGSPAEVLQWREAFLQNASEGPAHPRQGHQGELPEQQWFSLVVDANATLADLVEAHSFEKRLGTFATASFEAGPWQVLVSVPFTFLYGEEDVLRTGAHAGVWYEVESPEQLDRSAVERGAHERFAALGLPEPDLAGAGFTTLDHC